MNEGKELLYKIIDNEFDILSAYNEKDVICDDINLIELYTSMDEDNNNFYKVTDKIIDYVINETKYKNASFKANAIKVRDLLVGKMEYNLNVEMKKEYISTINTFSKQLLKLINSKTPDGVDVEILRSKLKALKKDSSSLALIKDFDFIKKIVKDYNEIAFEKNLYIVMKFVNEHNLQIIKTPKVNSSHFDIKLIIKPKLDDRIIEILDKLGIKPKDLPNYLLSEFKKCNVDEVYETYNMVRKNKAEDYGILHLIGKENLLSKLVLLLYSTPESIKGVVDSIRNKDGNIDITLLKILVNEVLPCFLVKNNSYFAPKNSEYFKIIGLLKENGVNYKALITRNPIFMISNYDVIDYVLKYFEMAGAVKKNVINRCYKTLSLNPALLIDNLMVLKKYNVNIELFFNQSNYTMLKVPNLDHKIHLVLSKNNLLNINPLDIELLNKLIMARVYKIAVGDVYRWSE